MMFVDSGAWIALFNHRDQHHVEAMTIYRALEQQDKRLYTTDYVVDETVTRLRYDLHHMAAVRFLDYIEGAESGSNVTVVAVDIDAFEQAKHLFRQYSSERLSFTDCTSFVVCKRHGISAAFAFDQHVPIMGDYAASVVGLADELASNALAASRWSEGVIDTILYGNNHCLT